MLEAGIDGELNEVFRRGWRKPSAENHWASFWDMEFTAGENHLEEEPPPHSYLGMTVCSPSRRLICELSGDSGVGTWSLEAGRLSMGEPAIHLNHGVWGGSYLYLFERDETGVRPSGSLEVGLDGEAFFDGWFDTKLPLHACAKRIVTEMNV